MQGKLKRIPELSTLDDIERLEEIHYEKWGLRPINLSYWNPSPNVSRKMEDAFAIDVFPSIVDYHFSYSLDVSERLLALVGFEVSSKGLLVTPSGSTSIVMVARYLSMLGIDAVTLLGPGYFTVSANLRAEGIRVDIEYLKRTENGFRLPTTLDLKKVRALWITNPVYCTGVWYAAEDILLLQNFLANGGILVCDECLAWVGHELCRTLGEWRGFIGIYSPHKGLCTNGAKYSFVVFPCDDQKFFDDWADALYGCLPASAVAAIHHSTSQGFDIYRRRFEGIVDDARRFVISAARTNRISVDLVPSGYLMTCYATHIEQAASLDKGFMKDLIFATAASFIPGIRNHFDPKIGLCFRVNLARDDESFRGALMRVLHYLQPPP